ncbi:hypothetical protein AgCh_007953 [Apium graveolens]
MEDGKPLKLYHDDLNKEVEVDEEPGILNFASKFAGYRDGIFLQYQKRSEMALGLILGIGRAFRRKRASSLDILSSKRGPRDYYKGKNCKPTGFHTRKGGYVVVQEKLPNYVVPDLTDFKLKPYVSQCAVEGQTSGAADAAK